MAPELAALPNDIDALKHTIVSLYEQIEALTETVLLLQQRSFGRKSEQPTVREQQELFGEPLGVEEVRAVSAEEAARYRIPVRAHTRKKRGRKPLPENLPEIVIVHDIPEEQKMCCANHMNRIGEETLEQLGVIPPQFYRIKHVRPKWGCGICDGEKTESPVVRIAPPPAQLFPKSIATPELIAWILTGKWVDGLPSYRLEKMLRRYGVEISRETLCVWMMQAAERVLPLLGLLREQVLAGKLVQIDETTVQVLREPGRAATTKSYLWAFRGGEAERPSLVFQYHPSRSGQIALEFLEDYEGPVQTDGYDGYGELDRKPGIVHAGCAAHARRRFVQAARLAKGGGLAAEALEYFRRLYAIEAEARKGKLEPQERKALRQQEAKPIWGEFKSWLEDKALRTPPKLTLGKAIGYTLGQWDRLVRYLEDGNIEIDTNLIENAIRPYCVGRRAWLFHDSPQGAKAGAVLFSLVESAKACGLEPYHYLRYVFTKILEMKPDDEFAALLPTRLRPQDIVLPPPNLALAHRGGS